MYESIIQPFLNGWLDFFTNPQKRVYWLYLFTACFIGLIYLYYKTSSFKSALHKLFAKRNWWSNTAKADYLLLIINNFIMLLLAKGLLAKMAVAYAIFYFISDYSTSYAILNGVLPKWLVATLFTTTLFIADDFTKYWVHRWLHTIPFLWPYHRVHHSSTALNFFTVFRTHPVEGVFFTLRSTITQGFVIGTFFFLFSNEVSLLMILGANAFNAIFNILGSNLRHSPIALPYPKWCEKILLSPAQHHIHHSKAKEHKNKNFGVVLAIWDIWFGSFHHSETSKELNYGLSFNNGQEEHKLKTLYIKPFFDSFKQLKKIFIKS